MPAISMFYGIVVYLYYADTRQHNLPHIHVKYQEHEAVIAIADGSTLEGSLPQSKMRLVLAWVEIHRDELLANWELAVNSQPPFKIDPLK